jgi:hypothetical protein
VVLTHRLRRELPQLEHSDTLPFLHLAVEHVPQQGGVLPKQVAVDGDRLATGFQHAVGHLAQLALPTDHHRRWPLSLWPSLHRLHLLRRLVGIALTVPLPSQILLPGQQDGLELLRWHDEGRLADDQQGAIVVESLAQPGAGQLVAADVVEAAEGVLGGLVEEHLAPTLVDQVEVDVGLQVLLGLNWLVLLAVKAGAVL